MPWIGETRLVLQRGMTGGTGNVYCGLHEFADMVFLLHFLRENDLFLDVGANIGSYTVLASGYCRAKTLAFEPDPEAAIAFKKNVIANDMQNLVTLYQLALGTKKCDVHFTVGRDATNQVVKTAGAYTRLVPQERLDDIVGFASPTFMKLDIEGYEDDAIQGAGAVLGKTSLQAISLETVTPQTELILHKHHFRKVYYDPFSRALSPSANYSTNSLFVRDLEFVRARVTRAEKIDVLGLLI